MSNTAASVLSLLAALGSFTQLTSARALLESRSNGSVIVPRDTGCPAGYSEGFSTVSFVRRGQLMPFVHDAELLHSKTMNLLDSRAFALPTVLPDHSSTRPRTHSRPIPMPDP